MTESTIARSLSSLKVSRSPRRPSELLIEWTLRTSIFLVGMACESVSTKVAFHGRRLRFTSVRDVLGFSGSREEAGADSSGVPHRVSRLQRAAPRLSQIGDTLSEFGPHRTLA